MKKIYLLSILTFTYAFNAGAGSAYDGLKFNQNQYEACKSVPMLSKSDYNKNKAFWDHAMKDCKVPLEVLPDTGFFNTMISKLDEEGRSGSDAAFLTSVGKRALEYVNQSNLSTRNLIACARNEKAWLDAHKLTKESCTDLEHKVMSAAGGVRESLRFNRMLSADGGPAYFKSHPNEAWKAWGDLAPDSTEPPSAQELQKMTAAYERDQRRCADAWAKSSEAKNYHFSASAANWGVDPSINFYQRCNSENLARHRADYLRDLAKAPILAFLGQKDPTAEQVALAAQKILANGLKEQQSIISALGESNKSEAAMNVPMLMPIPFNVAVGSRPKTPEEKAKALLKFMKYGPVVDELLRRNPGECKVAIGLANYIQNTDTKTGLAVAGGMVLVSIAAPEVLGAAGITGGLGAGTIGTLAALPIAGYVTSQNIEHLNDTQQAALSSLFKPLVGIEQVAAAKASVLADLAMFPLNFLGIGGAKFLNGKTIEAAENLLKSEAARESLGGLLKAKGMADPEIEATIAHLRSGKPALIESAANKVIKTLDLDPNELALLQAVQKGLGTKGERWAKLAVRLMPKDAKEREAAVKEAIAIFDKTNPAKFNDITRPKAVEAAFAAANFGVKDPAVIASHLTEWDLDGIEGLTKAFKLAKTKVESPAYLKIANVEDRQAKAFKDSLDDLMKDKPEFKAMTAAEREKVEGEMCSCAASCKL